jgi:hypothetical protein
VERREPPANPLDYGAPEPSAPLPPPAVAILLCVPMALVVFLWVPPPIRPVTPFLLFRWFWVVRAVAMVCALISMFLFCDKRVTRWPWFARLNLLINIPGLAACTFTILRHVIFHLPN